jgi:hypothetical protein
MWERRPRGRFGDEPHDFRRAARPKRRDSFAAIAPGRRVAGGLPTLMI